MMPMVVVVMVAIAVAVVVLPVLWAILRIVAIGPSIPALAILLRKSSCRATLLLVLLPLPTTSVVAIAIRDASVADWL